MLTKEKLDKMKCSIPGCKCDSRDGFFFHGRCHQSDRVTAFYDNEMLEVACAECGRPIADVKVTDYKGFGFLKGKCHDSTVKVFYVNGTLSIMCAKCNNPIATIAVAQ
jgi:ribosomal protein S27E